MWLIVRILYLFGCVLLSALLIGFFSIKNPQITDLIGFERQLIIPGSLFVAALVGHLISKKRDSQ